LGATCRRPDADCFVVEYACRRFGFAGVAIRSTTQDVEWPINDTARRVRDRLQRESLLGYLEAWGAPVRDPGFWSSHQEAMTLVRQCRYEERTPNAATG
jgi:hypothetical protein